MKRRLMITVLIMFVLFLAGCGVNRTISVTSGANDYVGKDYEDVEKELSGLGFLNITASGLQDLDSSSDSQQGVVTAITIADLNNFNAGDSFPSIVPIIINYHSVKEINPPSAGDDIQKQDHTILADLFKNAGFKNVKTEEVEDLNPDLYDEEFRNEVIIDGHSSFSKIDTFPIDSEVKVICHKPYKKYTVSIHADCRGNLLFDKYDVNISVGNEAVKRLPHGESADYEYKLKKGKYTITFTDAEDSSVERKEEIDVYSDMKVGYKLSCNSSSIDVNTEYTERDIELEKGQIQMSEGSSDFSGNYIEVIDKLKGIGFNNIKIKPIYDIYFGVFAKEGDTSSVSINGNKDFKRGDIFSSQDEVIVAYHSSYTNDPEYIAGQMIQAQEAAEQAAAEEASKAEKERLEALKGKTVAEAIKTVGEMGYTATYKNRVGTDMTPYAEEYGDCKVTKVDVSSQNKSVDVYFITAQEEADMEVREKLEAKLDSTAAWQCVERYGKNVYPYGFKLHYLVGRLNEEAVDENTWFLRAECTIENAFGNKRKGICDATVTGTTDHPLVVSFECY